MLAVAVPGDPGGTLIFTRMVSQGNSCEFGHYEYAHSFVRSLRIYSRAVHLIDHNTTFNNQVVQAITPIEQTTNPTLWEDGIDLSQSFMTAAFGQTLLPTINSKQNVTTAVFLNSNFDAMAYLPFNKPVTMQRLVKATIMTNTTMVNLFVPTGQTGLTPDAFQALREQLQHYHLQLVDQITYTGPYDDELAYDSLLEAWQGEN